uniref:BTB domain-containing protein n=1 Tax=Panagrolaimus sp. ES5 TaxID=591445 RepID=A0AC34F3J6_9BILA
MKGMLFFEDKEIPKIFLGIDNLGQALWERDEYKDFKIIVGNEGIVMVHKNVLCARSEFYEAMFRAKREEAVTNIQKITDFNLKTVQTAIKFFYDYNIFESLNLDDAFELARFADKYNINDLQDKLELFLIYRLSLSTVCQLANTSKFFNLFKLRKHCFDFLMTCSKHGVAIDIVDFAAELV